MRKSSEKFLIKASGMFDIPSDIIAGQPRIEISGNRELLIENHGGILEYGDNEIDINAGSLIVRVKGNGLQLRAMNPGAISLDGLILSVEFVL